MRLAYDASAFNHGLAAGIFNVSAQTLLAILEADPDIKITAVLENATVHDLAQPLLSSPRIRTLDWDEQYGHLENEHKAPLSDDPQIHLRVDGKILQPVTSTPTDCTFQIIDRPQEIRVQSRTNSPAELWGSGDRRQLGIGVVGLAFDVGRARYLYPHSDTRLTNGFYHAEIAHRWTDGNALVPRDMYVDFSEPFSLTVRYAERVLYNDLAPLAADVMKSVRQSLRPSQRKLAEASVSSDLRQSSVRLFHSNHFNPRLLPGMANVATVHDIIPVLFPSFFAQDAIEHFQRFMTVMKGCDHLFAVSEATKLDLIAHCDMDPQRITVTPNDCDERFRPITRELATPVAARYGLHGPFVLTVGTIEPRKNHTRMVQAFHLALNNRNYQDLKFLIVGGKGWFFEETLRYVMDNRLQDRVIFADFVPLEDLVALYSAASCLVYASLYEGFGLPVLEALACGCPVITSLLSSMPEVAGDAALLIDPLNVDEIAAAITRIFDEPSFANTLRQRGLKQRQKFSWARTGAVHAKVYREFVK